MNESEITELLNAAEQLIEIVEGVPSVRWAFGARRLKDSPEWVKFYVVARKALQPPKTKP